MTIRRASVAPRSMIAGTIIARNYFAQSRVLSSSFIRQHPGSRFVTLVIDGADGDRRIDGDDLVLLPGDLGQPPGEWEQMAGLYSVMEFATAMKPAFLRHLLTFEDGGELPPAVLYLDPDVMVYRPFPEVFSTAAHADIALTPHVLHPLPREGLEPGEDALMHSGLFNLGFICVGQGALPFLDWWHERLRVDAVVDFPNALFTDQRWVDWVPSLFGCAVLRDHGLNVAYWNIHERPLSRAGDGEILAAGDPLKFFHFSGYDPYEPWVLSKHFSVRARRRLSDVPIVARLCHEYREALVAEGYERYRQLPYGFGRLPNGVHLSREVRAAYRVAVKDAIQAHVAPPPAPFGFDSGEGFTRWLAAPSVGPPQLGIGVWHLQMWRDRPDLQAAFPDPAGADAHRFRNWFDNDPGARQAWEDLNLPDATTAPLPVASRRPARRLDHGWNVIGYLSSEHGVGEVGRRTRLAIEAAGIATHPVAVPAAGYRQLHPNRSLPATDLLYRDSVLCVNADQVERTIRVIEGPVGPYPGRSGRQIGFWFWEVDEFPGHWSASYDRFEEVWCPSEFTAGAVAAVAPVRVRVVPLPVWAPSRATPFSRQQLGLPAGFFFLFVYDFHSIAERKNPIGLIEAYRRAFTDKDGTTLVLKSINGAVHPNELERVRYAARERDDILVCDGYLHPHRLQGLLELCDCFVSLHRSEGFGLNLAAAMSVGRPVVATGYSGNLTFMDEHSAFLVPYELVPVGPGKDPYPPSAYWAAPDLDAAGALMRKVFEDPAAAAVIAQRGRSALLERHSFEAVGAVIAPVLLGTPSGGQPSSAQPLKVLSS